MEPKEMTFNVFTKDGKPSELIIREGDAPDLLPINPPVAHNITGTILAPAEFIRKRLIKDLDQIDVHTCHILVNRQEVSITLVTNENDPYTKGTITGKLLLHPKFMDFGINTKKNWDPNELGQYFKMNRAFFPDKQANMKLVTDLLNFVADVNSKVEKQKSEKGDFKDNYSGVVMSNIPGTFQLKIPIFKGLPAETIEVEFYASVNGREVSLQLFSPGANQLLEDIRDKVIDEQVEELRRIAPEIVIIEV